MIPGMNYNSDDVEPRPFASYIGSKGGAGVAERVAAEFPPHSVYVEPFIGGGAVLRRKSPALCSIAIDADAVVTNAWTRMRWPGLIVVNGDGICWLEENGPLLPADALVYCDPPYPLSTRGWRPYYDYELTDDDHARLLRVLLQLPCSVVISSYDNELYARTLADWRHVCFPAMTRGGLRTEHLWCRSTIAAFDVGRGVPGNGFRERERIKRKAARWASRFSTMPPAEQDAVLSLVLSERARRGIPHRHPRR